MGIKMGKWRKADRWEGRRTEVEGHFMRIYRKETDEAAKRTRDEKARVGRVGERGNMRGEKKWKRGHAERNEGREGGELERRVDRRRRREAWKKDGKEYVRR
jgi:hypothetical protein